MSHNISATTPYQSRLLPLLASAAGLFSPCCPLNVKSLDVNSPLKKGLFVGARPTAATSAFGGRADVIGRKADIANLMSALGGKADSLAHRQNVCS